MSQSDLKDDVDRLFACFKCGVTPPESVFKEKRPRQRIEGASRNVVATPELPQGGSIEKDKCCKSASLAIKLKCGKKFSPVVFYGSPQGLPLKRPLRLLKLLHGIRVDLTKQNDFSKSKEVWATFPRQEEAVKFAKSHSQVFVFSYQDHLNGQRRFLASTYDELWQRYKNMNPNVRHHYEVIQEGFPCHLYFDLEFNKRINKEKNADEMVDILISITFDALKEKYSIEGKHEWVVELDSSTEEKFSRHLIFHLPRTAFKDNSHAGAFVSEISSRIENAGANDPKLEKLYIKESLSSSCDNLFLDNAVYSRNRCFRLVFSSKSGKKSFLLPTGRFRCKNMEEKQVFMESLICRTDVDCSKLLICKQDPTFQKALNFEFEVNEPHIIPKELVPKGSTGQHLSGRSPFPSLDCFVESIASNGNIPGRIRSWYLFSEYGLMVYSMLRNRYCERIGREHKSNHVMYIVDFRREGYYQKCYDPDCKGYRSPMRPIPLDVIPNDITLVNSVERECCEEVLHVNFDQQVLKENLEVPSCENVESIADSCKENSDWWQEAVKFADYIENGHDWIDDLEWWMDVEKSMVHLEHQRGQLLCT